MPLLPALGAAVSAGWAVWAVGCLAVAWLCLRAARDYRDTDPQPAPDEEPGIDDWAADWNRRYHLPAYDPNHRTTKGD